MQGPARAAGGLAYRVLRACLRSARGCAPCPNMRRARRWAEVQVRTDRIAALRAGFRRSGGGLPRLGTWSLPHTAGYGGQKIGVATGSCRAALGWTAGGGCPYADGRERPSLHWLPALYLPGSLPHEIDMRYASYHPVSFRFTIAAALLPLLSVHSAAIGPANSAPRTSARPMPAA